MTSSPRDRAARKSLGAYYSPADLVAAIVAWAVRSEREAVLDPSSGDGIFLVHAAERLRSLGAAPEAAAQQISGVDVNPDAVRDTTAAVRGCLDGAPFAAREGSFFSVEPPDSLFPAARPVDAIVGNPPYIRYQHFAGEERRRALARAREAGVTLAQLASSWAPFVVHAGRFLRPGGRMGLILPAELIHASYAAPVRRFLRESFAHVDIITFRGAVFPGAQENVVVLLADGWGSSRPGTLAIVEAEDGADLAPLERLFALADVFPPESEPFKWSPGHGADGPGEVLGGLTRSGSFCLLRSVGKAGIGYVSGANDFFVLSPREAERRRLPGRSLLPTLLRARQLPALRLLPEDVEQLRATDERCLLWLPTEPLSPADRAYAEEGERAGLAERYKCRVRSPWYRVPGVVVPDGFLTYMSDTVPRFCVNMGGATTTNNLLALRLDGVPPAVRFPFAIAFYNSATLLSCERTARTYGGGVLKLEPREADRLVVPSPTLVETCAASLLELAEPLSRALRANTPSAIARAVGAIDELVFGAAAGSAGPMDSLAEARESLLDRRRRRPTTRPLDSSAPTA